MKVREDGCVICGSTWGDYWRDIDGQKMFFCCEVCADEFSNIVAEVKKRKGWGKVDEFNLAGDFRGRDCEAFSGSETFRFNVFFNADGSIRNFVEKPQV